MPNAKCQMANAKWRMMNDECQVGAGLVGEKGTSRSFSPPSGMSTAVFFKNEEDYVELPVDRQAQREFTPAHRSKGALSCFLDKKTARSSWQAFGSPLAIWHLSFEHLSFAGEARVSHPAGGLGAAAWAASAGFISAICL
jgi:hypothetical protein